MKNEYSDFPKYTSFDGWYANEQKRWELTDEQKEIIRKRRLARLAGQVATISVEQSPQQPTSTSNETSHPSNPDSTPVSTVDTDTQTPESKLVHFAAETFEEAQQLSNPLPDAVIDKVIRLKGNISLYSFVEPDESDKTITRDQEEEYYKGVKSLRVDYERTINGRSTFISHFGFAQYDTPQYTKRRARGEKIQVTDRIYMNPKQLDRLEIYKEFLERAEEEELEVCSKIYDSISDTKGGLAGLRQDGIVIYATPENKNQTLALVEDIYQNHKESFEGRTSGPQTCEIAPGLALGSEPVKYTGSESLSSIRTKILEASYKQVVKLFNRRGITNPTDEQMKKNVRKYAEMYMQKNNISTHNWSFDLNQ